MRTEISAKLQTLARNTAPTQWGELQGQVSRLLIEIGSNTRPARSRQLAMPVTRKPPHWRGPEFWAE